ncbi:hypothetical protein [Mesorhizobium sanjuanii]|uniref:hypothetical protein n=1 Tax=Mesorhizobium sanjuanii TaxID=2037900 RepID=UPI001FDF86C0|nr:hypothetical protein [Mesorhizobium sanjuanii]
MVRFFQHHPRYAENTVITKFSDRNHAATRGIGKFLDKQIVAAIAIEDERVGVETLAVVGKRSERGAVQLSGFGYAWPVDQPIGNLPIEGAASKFDFLHDAVGQPLAEKRQIVSEKAVAAWDWRWAVGNWHKFARKKAGNALSNQRYGSGEQVVAAARQPEPIAEHGPSLGDGNAIEASGKFGRPVAGQHFGQTGEKGALAAEFERQDRRASSRGSGSKIDYEVDRTWIARWQRLGAACQ